MCIAQPSSASRSASPWLLALAGLAACGNGKPAPGVAPGLGEPALGVDASGASVDEEEEDEEEDAGRRDAGRRDGGADASRDAGVGDASAADGAVDAGSPRGDASAYEPGLLASVERLLIADGKEPRVTALDVAERRVLETFPVAGLGSVHAGSSGRFGYVLQSGSDTVHVVDMGLSADPSSESPTLTGPVQLLAPAVYGPKPAGFSAHGRRAFVFFEGAAQLAALFDDPRAVQGPEYLFAAGPAHQGLVLPLGERVLTTKGVGDNQAQLQLLDRALASVATPSFSCAEPAGAALGVSMAIVGCREGVLRIRVSDLSSTLIPYPASTGSNAARVTRIVSNARRDVFATTLEPEQELCVVRDAFQCVAAPSAPIDYSFDVSGKRLFALTADGILRVYDSESLNAQGELMLLPALPVGAAERPALALGRSNLYVSDPQAGMVHIVDTAKLKRIDGVSVPGVPTHVAVFRYPDQ